MDIAGGCIHQGWWKFTPLGTTQKTSSLALPIITLAWASNYWSAATVDKKNSLVKTVTLSKLYNFFMWSAKT